MKFLHGIIPKKEGNMNISKYKALLTAVDVGSLSSAAQKLGYTQS